MILSALIISKIGSYYQIQTCGKVAFGFGGSWSDTHSLPPLEFQLHPQCVNASDNTVIPIQANMSGLPEEVGAALGLSFGMGLWLAIIVHALGVECYLWLTPAEATRLRNVSYERQLEAGSNKPGNAGLTVDRFGDADEFVPARSGSAPSLTEK